MDNNNKQREIAVDLDATMAEYHHGDLDKYGLRIGAPIPEMVEKIKQEMAQGTQVFIFTARISPSDNSFEQALEATQSYLNIAEWCQKTFGTLLPITNVKSRNWTEMWDDRGRQVLENTGVFATDLLEAQTSQAR